jgi:hypothetical protein
MRTLRKDIAPFRLMEALNAHLRPDPIAILACEIASGGLARALFVRGPRLCLSHIQPPRAADVRERAGVAGSATAR